jgi:hypothetical protein
MRDYSTQLVRNIVNEGQKFRIIGDNINWTVGVRDERADRHAHMHHAFGSAVIQQRVNFPECSDDAPRQSTSLANDFLTNDIDCNNIREVYVYLFAQVIAQHIPTLKFVDSVVANGRHVDYADKLASTSNVIPLPVQFKNEMKVDDVCDILDTYEDLVHDVYGDVDDTTSIHIGGDLLPRERFSCSKRLRATSTDSKSLYKHLTPITFEFFHLQIKVLEHLFSVLHDKTSAVSLGTMYAEQVRLNRHGVNENVKCHFAADSDFAVSYTNAVMIEATLHYFGMEDVLCTPTRHVPPTFQSDNERCSGSNRHWVI